MPAATGMDWCRKKYKAVLTNKTRESEITMRPINEKLAADILEVGKQEFLEKGFLGASMRNIASRLSVTTGALYRYYTDKESIFDALVKEAAETLEQKYREMQQQFAMQPVQEQVQELPEVSEEGHDWMIEYI